MKCVIKHKHPIKNFFANILRDNPGCAIKVEILDGAQPDSNLLAKKFFEEGVKYKSSGSDDILESSLPMRIIVDERAELYLRLTLYGICGNAAFTIDEKYPVVDYLGSIGELQEGSNDVKLTCILYQTDDDKGVIRHGKSRYHIDLVCDLVDSPRQSTTSTKAIYVV